MSDKVRIGLIGTSWWAERLYLPSLAPYARAEVIAICGRNGERAQEVANRFDIPQVFTDYHEMIARADIDAVVVSTPDDTHYDMVMAALDRKLHVLCEKPVALNADHALAMYQKAQAAGVKHMVLYSWRWLPQFRHMAQLIQQGYTGRIYHAEFRMIGEYGRSGEYGWRFDADRANGILGDLGSHMIDTARWFMGEFASVNANLITAVGRNREGVNSANEAALLTAEFTSGAHASIQVSSLAYLGDEGNDMSVALYGERGTLRMRMLYNKPEHAVYGAQAPDETFRQLPIPEAWLAGTDSADVMHIFATQPIGPRYFVDCILDDRPIAPDLHDGYKAQQVIDAAIESHNTGRRIHLNED